MLDREELNKYVKNFTTKKKKNLLPGTKILAIGKSKHAGQKGTIILDYGNMYLVKVDDIKYTAAYTDSSLKVKCIQIDTTCVKEIKNG